MILKENGLSMTVDSRDYLDVVEEEVRSWSYMKFPYIKELGPKEVGTGLVRWPASMSAISFPRPRRRQPLSSSAPTPRASPNHMSMHYHWARLIETLHAAEMMKELLLDPDLQGTNLITKGERCGEGIGLLEAPRGTLFHHYRVNEQDLITMCNLIVSTTNNNEPMNRAVNAAAVAQMTGKAEITEPMMNAVEVAIRAYDPCLSCATHAMGQMPLEVTLYDAAGAVLDQQRKGM